MLKTFFLFALLALALVGCSQQQEPVPATEDMLTVGVDPDYAPFEFVDAATGEVVGFDIDLMREIGRLNGWQINFREMPFEMLLSALHAGQSGAAISAITITPKRQAVVDFSDPYYLTGQSFVVLAGDSSFTEPFDLRGRRVGVQLGSTGEELAKRTDGALVFLYDDIREAFRLLGDGDLDVVIDDCPSALTYLKRHAEFEIVGPELDAQYYGIAVHKGAPARLEKINQALAKLIGDGTYDSLHLKWFGYDWAEGPAHDSSLIP